MKKKNEWYRDEIERLKWNQSNSRWKFTATVTIFLALSTFLYSNWYN